MSELPATSYQLPARSVRRASLGLLAVVLLLAGGCMRGCPSERPPIHLNPNMDNQPKYLPQAESAFFADGATMRPPVPGTVARGELRADRLFYAGVAEGRVATAIPLEGGEAILRRGEVRYGIFCGPCHGERGDGKGMLWIRSQVASADLTEERFREMPAGQIYDRISNGFGLMPPYAHQIPVADRWAIVAHVRVLQGSEPVFGNETAAAAGETAVPGNAATTAEAAGPAAGGGTR